MSNLFNNRLSAELSANDMARLVTCIDDMEATMPFLIGLTDEECRRLYERIVHTRMLAGSEAYYGSLLFYHSSKSAAANGVPGSQLIAKRLAERFPGGSSQASNLEEDMENPVDPAPLA